MAKKIKIHAKYTRVIRHEGETITLTAGKTHEVDEALLGHPFVQAYIKEGSLSTADSRESAKEEAAAVTESAKKDASAIIESAKEEAAKIIEAAKKEAEQITTEALNKAAEIETAASAHGKGKKKE